MAKPNNISITGDNNITCIGNNITLNIDLKDGGEKNQVVRVISGSTCTYISNCYDPGFSYCARKSIDENIQNMKKGKPKILHGTVGTGKTAAALQFIEEGKANFAVSWFLDVSADEDRIVTSLTDLAEKLNVPYHKLFQTIEQKAEDSNVIFLLDDVERRPFSEWFRKLWNIRHAVYIIITTNNACLALDFPEGDELLVDKFDEALPFLREDRAQSDEEDLQNLCKHFGWNILGLTAAKLYMLKTKTSARQYLEMQYDREAACKVRQSETNSHNRTLYTSVRACLEVIDRDVFSAITTVSFISHSMIPEYLLSSQLSSNNQANVACLNDLQDQLKSLVHITTENGTRFFSFHAFTQYVMRDMIEESEKANVLCRLAGILVRYFSKDNRFTKGDFRQRTMREHAELFLQEWEDKEKDDRTSIALATLSALVGFTYTQQQPPVEHKLDDHFRRAIVLLHTICRITQEDLQPSESLLGRILKRLQGVFGRSLENCSDGEIYGITAKDFEVARQLFTKLSQKSSRLLPSIIEELVFTRTINKQDLLLFPEAVKKNEALKNKIETSEPLAPNDVKFFVRHGVAHSVDSYSALFLPELYLSVIYSFGRNYFYKNRETVEQPNFYIDLLKLAYCLAHEISERMTPSEGVLHEFLVESNGLLYLLVNDDCVSEDDKCIKKEKTVHCTDLKNAIDRYRQWIGDERRFFEMGMLKKTKDDKYSKLVCHQQILKCYSKLISLAVDEDREQFIRDGVKHCDHLFELLGTYAAQDADRKKEDLVRFSRHLNAIAEFYLRINREEFYPRVIKIFTLSAEHAEKYDLTLFHVEALVGLADIFSRIGKNRFPATHVSIRHLKQCDSKESFREMQRQKPHLQERIRQIQKQNLATVVTHYVLKCSQERGAPIAPCYFDDRDVGQTDDTSSLSSTSVSHDDVSDDPLHPDENSVSNGEGNEEVPREQRHDPCPHPSSPILSVHSALQSLPESNIGDPIAIGINYQPPDNAMNKHLLKLAKNIPGEWKQLAKFLNIKDSKIEEIALNHPSHVVWQAYLMLKHWWTSRDEQARPWREELRDALGEIDRNDLALNYTGNLLQTDAVPDGVLG